MYNQNDKETGKQNKLRKDLELVVALPLKSGKSYAWGFLDPARLLQHYVRESAHFRSLIAGALQNSPDGKLRLILTEDEITPGNVFRGSRKLHAWYYSFREFGLHLRCEQSWICCALLQSSIVPLVVDELTCVVKELLSSMFTKPLVNFSVGVPVELENWPRLVTALLEDLHDADAMRGKWSIMGAGGVRPCMLCMTMFKKGHSASAVRAEFTDLTDLCWKNVEKYQATDKDIWDAQDHLLELHAAGLNGQCKKMETLLGMHCRPKGILACKELRPFVRPSKSTYDSMHCLYSSGIADTEITLLCETLAALKFDFKKINDICNSWLPKHRLLIRPDGVKGGAGDVLRAVPVLRYVVEKFIKPKGLLPEQIASFQALADVVKQLQKMKLLSSVPDSAADELQRLMELHFDAFKVAYDTDKIVPKHHYSMHIPSQVKWLGIVVDTFVTERKHRLAKEVAEHYDKSKAVKLLELHMVSRVNLLQLDEMQDDIWFGLLEPTHPQPDGGLVASKAKLAFGTTVESGQVLLVGGSCFLLSQCVRDTTGLSLVVKRCDFLGVDAAAKLWRVSEQCVAFSVQAPRKCSALWLYVFWCL